jgi:hypothetical protein
MTTFKAYDDLAYSAFYSCHVVGCDLEAEKLYSTETQIRDVCLDHHKELTEKDYK